MSIEAGTILPSIVLPSGSDGTLMSLRRGAGPRVIISVHSASCAACAEYVQAIAANDEIRSRWGGRVVAVVAGSGMDAVAEALGSADHLQILADPGQKFAGGRASVIVADEWGEVYFALDSGDGHDFPTPEGLSEWIRFISIQCPECENPEGEWRNV